jgi:hypothetical protein
VIRTLVSVMMPRTHNRVEVQTQQVIRKSDLMNKVNREGLIDNVNLLKMAGG